MAMTLYSFIKKERKKKTQMGEDWKNHVSSKHTDKITFRLRSNDEIEEYTNRHHELRITRLQFYGRIKKWNKLSTLDKKLLSFMKHKVKPNL